MKFVGTNEKDKFNEETRFLVSSIYIDNEGSEGESYILPKSLALGIEFFLFYFILKFFQKFRIL